MNPDFGNWTMWIIGVLLVGYVALSVWDYLKKRVGHKEKKR